MSKKYDNSLIAAANEKNWLKIFREHGLTNSDKASVAQTSRQFYFFFQRHPDLLKPERKTIRQFPRQPKMAFIPRSNLVLVHEFDVRNFTNHSIKLKSTITWETRASTPISNSKICAIHPINEEVFLSLEESSATLWSLKTCEKIATLTLLNKNNYRCHTSSRIFFSGPNSKFKYYNLSNLKEITERYLKSKFTGMKMRAIGEWLLEIPDALNRSYQIVDISDIDQPKVIHKENTKRLRNIFTCAPDGILYSIHDHKLYKHLKDLKSEVIFNNLFEQYSAYKKGDKIRYELHFLDNHRAVCVSHNIHERTQLYDDMRYHKSCVSVINLKKREITFQIPEAGLYQIGIGQSKIYNHRPNYTDGSYTLETFTIREAALLGSDASGPSSRTF